jgi:hypothetical protein
VRARHGNYVICRVSGPLGIDGEGAYPVPQSRTRLPDKRKIPNGILQGTVIPGIASGSNLTCDLDVGYCY